MPLTDTIKIESDPNGGIFRRILFRNFSGKKTMYNEEGDRNFCLVLTDEEAEAMLQDGFHVKRLRPSEEGEVGEAYVSVKVSSKIRKPRVILLSSRGQTPLDEDMFQMADWVDIDWVDLIIRPSSWTKGNRSGVTCYLQTIYIKVMEDELERKYAHVAVVDINGQAAIEAGDPDIIEAEVLGEYVHHELEG